MKFNAKKCAISLVLALAVSTSVSAKTSPAEFASFIRSAKSASASAADRVAAFSESFSFYKDDLVDVIIEKETGRDWGDMLVKYKDGSVLKFSITDKGVLYYTGARSKQVIDGVVFEEVERKTALSLREPKPFFYESQFEKIAREARDFKVWQENSSLNQKIINGKRTELYFLLDQNHAYNRVKIDLVYDGKPNKFPRRDLTNRTGKAIDRDGQGIPLVSRELQLEKGSKLIYSEAKQVSDDQFHLLVVTDPGGNKKLDGKVYEMNLTHQNGMEAVFEGWYTPHNFFELNPVEVKDLSVKISRKIFGLDAPKVATPKSSLSADLLD